jgi:polyhydroxybutyrate depolymerase
MRSIVRTSGVLALGAVLGLTACSSGSTAKAANVKSAASSSKVAAVDPASVPATKSSGCGAAAAGIAKGQTKETMTSGGDARWYFRQVPPAHDGTTPVPLVLDLHGYSEGAQIHLMMSGLSTFGDTKGFVTLTPQGTGPVARWDTTLGSKDLKFLGDLLDTAESQLCIDTNRVFVTGLSNGAFMTSAVACQFNDRIAAVSPVAGVRTIKGCTFKRSMPLVAFHGTGDQYVTFDGGLGQKALDLPAPDGSGKKLGDTLTPAQRTARSGDSIPTIMAAWAKRNGCGSTRPTEEAIATDVTKVTYPCPKGAETILYRVTGGGHSWPGSTFSQSIASIVGPTTMNVNADEIMWAFFMQHPLNPATK